MRDTVPPSIDSSGPSEAGGLVPFAHQKWTLDTLKIHYDSRLADMQKYFSDILSVQEQTNRDRFTQAEKAVSTAFMAADKAVQAAMAASEKAVLKAENAAEKRAEASNEIRAAMIDQQSKFADKNATETQFEAHAVRITELKEALTARLDKIDLLLASGTAKDEGKGQAMSQTTALIFAVIGAFGVIATIVISSFR